MRRVLFVMFYAIFAAMIAVSVVATLERGVFTALADRIGAGRPSGYRWIG